MLDPRTPVGTLFEEMMGLDPSAPTYPTADVEEDDNRVRVTAEIPGTARDDVNIEVSPGGDALTIRGEKRQEEERSERGFRTSERVYGSFQRSIPLPSRVNPDKAEANLDSGVLTVNLPKADGEAGPRRIQVS
jgi:HSP20 family protein